MMMFDEELPQKKEVSITRNLEPLSLDELAHYITELQGEITRTEAEIMRKKAHMDSASSIFK
jgi:uncharacterized small protein (DUF1192 family)